MDNNFTNTDQNPLEEFKNLNTEDKILQVSSQYTVPEGKTKEEAYKELMNKINDGAKPTIKLKSSRTPYYYAIAALLLLLVGLPFLFRQNTSSPEKVLADKGAHTDYELPDGTMVHLNSGSEIEFSKADFMSKRQLNLTGEAFFEVKKGSSFLITTPNGTVEILGTTLNVIARGKEFSVTCHTGKVMVTSGDKSEIITKGERVVKEADNLIKTSGLNLEKAASWQKGEFNFVDKPLISIFEEVERQFNVTVDATGVDKRFFTGTFSNKNLDEALDIICTPMELNYEIKQDKTVIITRKNK